MKIIECLHIDSRCYKAAEAAFPLGIVVHSTGVNNTSLKRYVQPSKDDPHYDELIALLGKNTNGNSWNRSVNKSAHYVIGKLADGTVAVAHLLPEEYCAWGVGKGKKGSYNYNPTSHIQFEICEDNLKNEAYFKSCYNAAVSLCADICSRHGWEADVIVSHKEAYKKGYASNHADIDHWLKKFGLTMNNFRKDVDLLLHPPKPIAVGDTVQFTGSKQYTNSGKLTGKKAKPCQAVVKQIYKLGSAKHPYLIKGSGVYGWVDEGNVKPM